MNPLDGLPLLADREPPEVLVHDEPEACPYIQGQTSRLPLRLPLRALATSEVDDRLAAGDRRHGALLYRPACPACDACEAIRIDVDAFTPSRSQKRALARGRRELRVEVGLPVADDERVALYERHKNLRDLRGADGAVMTLKGYQRFLVDSCCDVFEMRYLLDGRLVGVAVVDVGEHSLSAVYCYFDPELPKLSIGTYSILEQVELCRRRGRRWLYLGLFIGDNAHMRYKARFLPHERRVGGAWRRYERGG